jgi:hypothetical protein
VPGGVQLTQLGGCVQTHERNQPWREAKAPVEFTTAIRLDCSTRYVIPMRDVLERDVINPARPGRHLGIPPRGACPYVSQGTASKD